MLWFKFFCQLSSDPILDSLKRFLSWFLFAEGRIHSLGCRAENAVGFGSLLRAAPAQIRPPAFGRVFSRKETRSLFHVLAKVLRPLKSVSAAYF